MAPWNGHRDSASYDWEARREKARGGRREHHAASPRKPGLASVEPAAVNTERNVLRKM